MWKQAFLDELEKISGSRLRGAVQVVRGASRPTSDGGRTMYHLRLSGKNIGEMEITNAGHHIGMSKIHPKYRGLGLGRKFYSEVAKASGGTLRSGHVSRSESAERVWQSMIRRKRPIKFSPPGTPSINQSPASAFEQEIGLPASPASPRGGFYTFTAPDSWLPRRR